MNRYDIEDVDCILAFSGGMDATAVLQYLLDNGKKPYIFHHQWASNPTINKLVRKASNKVENYYGVKVVDWTHQVEANNQGFPNRNKSNEHYDKLNLLSPSLPKWSAIAMMANYNMPWINEIYWGMCYGGMLKRGDGDGDKLMNYVDGKLTRIPPYEKPMDKSNYDDRHKQLFNGYLQWLEMFNIDSNYIAPLGHYSKLELYKMLPNDIKDSIVTCIKYKKTNYKTECGSCHKCKELDKVKQAYAAGL